MGLVRSLKEGAAPVFGCSPTEFTVSLHFPKEASEVIPRSLVVGGFDL